MSSHTNFWYAAPPRTGERRRAARRQSVRNTRPLQDRERHARKIQALWRGQRVRRELNTILRQNRHRNRVIREFLETEKSYNASLDFLVNNVRQQLDWQARHSSHPIVGFADMRALFSNVQQLYELSSQLIQFLEPVVQNWSSRATFGDEFLRIAPFLRIYQEYCNNYPQAQAKLIEVEGKAAFARFWAPFAASSGSLSLGSYLIMPVQRVPRYVLLFREFIRSTWPTHPDYGNLVAAKEACESIAQGINSGIDELNATGRDADMLEAQNFFAAFVEILAPSRRFVRKDPLLLLREDGHTDRVWLWLFNDLFVVSTKLSEDVFTHEGHGLLTQNGSTVAIVQDLPMSDLISHGFTIVASTGSFTFSCDAFAQKASLVTELRRHIGSSAEGIFQASIKGVAVRTDAKKRQYTAFIIELRRGEGADMVTTTVTRRFADFEQLRKDLARAFPRTRLPKLPPKRYFNVDARQVQSKSVALSAFLQECCLRLELRQSDALKDFLELRGPMALSPRERISLSHQRSETGPAQRAAAGAAPRRSSGPAGAGLVISPKGSSHHGDLETVEVQVPEGAAVSVRMNRFSRCGDVIAAMCYEMALGSTCGFALFCDGNATRGDHPIAQVATHASADGFGRLAYPPTDAGAPSPAAGEQGFEAVPIEAHEFPLRILQDAQRRHGDGARLLFQRMVFFAGDAEHLRRCAHEEGALARFLGGQAWRDLRFSAVQAGVQTTLDAAAAFALAKVGPATPQRQADFADTYKVVPPLHQAALRRERTAATIASPLLGFVDLQYYALDLNPRYKDKLLTAQLWSTDPAMPPLLVQAPDPQAYAAWKAALSRACAAVGELNDQEARAAISRRLRSRPRAVRSQSSAAREQEHQREILAYVEGRAAAVCAGALRKKARAGAFRRNWNERWFLLLGNKLFYFKDPLTLQLSREFWRGEACRRWERMGELRGEDAAVRCLAQAAATPLFGSMAWRVTISHPSLRTRNHYLLHVLESMLVLTDLEKDYAAFHVEVPYAFIELDAIDITTDALHLRVLGGELAAAPVHMQTPHGYDIKRLMDTVVEHSTRIGRARAKGRAGPPDEPVVIESPVEVLLGSAQGTARSQRRRFFDTSGRRNNRTAPANRFSLGAAQAEPPPPPPRMRNSRSVETLATAPSAAPAPDADGDVPPPPPPRRNVPSLPSRLPARAIPRRTSIGRARASSVEALASHGAPPPPPPRANGEWKAAPPPPRYPLREASMPGRAPPKAAPPPPRPHRPARPAGHTPPGPGMLRKVQSEFRPGPAPPPPPAREWPRQPARPAAKAAAPAPAPAPRDPQRLRLWQ